METNEHSMIHSQYLRIFELIISIFLLQANHHAIKNRVEYRCVVIDWPRNGFISPRSLGVHHGQSNQENDTRKRAVLTSK